MNHQRARIATATSLLAAFALLSLCACDRFAPDPQRPRNLLLVTVDTLRADHVSEYGYDRTTTPALAWLADRSVVFERAYAQAASTAPSLASLLTSLYPHQHGVLETYEFALAPEHLTLAEYLREAGFTTGAVLGIGVLMPSRQLDQGFESYSYTRYTNRQYWRTANEITDEALRWLERRGEEPFFLWVHYFEPHQPYDIVPEEYRRRFVDAPSAHPLLRGVEPGSPRHTTIKAKIDAYDGALAYVDSEIGRLLAGVDARGLMARSMIVLTADHGETLGEHGQHGHVFALWEPVVRVPLMISLPDIAPQRVQTPVELVDVFPTVLSALGNDGGDLQLQGRPLPLPRRRRWFSPRARLAERGVHAETYFQDKRVGMRIEGSVKTVLTQTESGAGDVAIYDLATDPQEERNLVSSLADARTRVEDLRAWMVAGVAAPGLIRQQPGEAEMLRALGYLE